MEDFRLCALYHVSTEFAMLAQANALPPVAGGAHCAPSLRFSLFGLDISRLVGYNGGERIECDKSFGHKNET